MKIRYLRLFSFFLILSSCQTKGQSNKIKSESIKKNNEPINLDVLDVLGRNFNDKGFQSVISNFKNPEIVPYTGEFIDYNYWSEGIMFRVDTLKNINSVFIYNDDINHMKQNTPYSGELPFKLSINENLKEIKNKLGEGRLNHSFGRWEEIWTWEIESYKIITYFYLANNDDRTSDKINYMVFMKNK